MINPSEISVSVQVIIVTRDADGGVHQIRDFSCFGPVLKALVGKRFCDII